MASEEKILNEIEKQSEAGQERRTFIEKLLKIVVGIWGFAFLGVVISYLKAPLGVRTFEEKAKRVGPVDEIEIGGAKFVPLEQRPFWVIRTDNDQLVALPATCTHLRCILKWDGESGRLLCPCHEGAFDVNGNVVAGPPPKPLQPLQADVKGGIIYVSIR